MADIIFPHLSYGVQGAFFEVHKELRHLDLSEEGWEKALLLALKERGIAAERQAEYELRYRGYRIGRFFVDLLVDGRLVVELKVLDSLQPIHQAQVLAYLKATGLKLGILVNFGGDRLVFQRIPNFLEERSSERKQTRQFEARGDLLHPELTGDLRALLYDVHSELGPGFMHMHYRRAVQIELRQHDIPFEVKKEITIHFRREPIETREVRLLVVDSKVLLAPVAVRVLGPAARGRLRQYLRLLGLQLGLVANFHAAHLEIETVRI